ncbi:chemotaxis protein CheX [Paenibacillus cremeus]|uniref:Chemotaxis protein CheX n=1 Tax=Paenibacillus cremeus TaxID=2163881 RepID=A0A559KDM5_9BACL|nr:chemotaxis protein CheX [Paenibacillus cremeus]TVY10225.1 chemotaxis protein CheX [Paenibacillus cremeus]
MNVNYINPFIETTTDICDKVAHITAKLGKPHLKREIVVVNDSVVVSVGVTGEMRGSVYLTMSLEDALYVAGKMMGTSLRKLDEISKSAIKELMNMIIGNTATVFSNRGIQINITPPNLFTGSGMEISSVGSVILCAPIILDIAYKLEMAVALE